LAGVPAPAKRETENEFFHVRWLPFCLFFFSFSLTILSPVLSLFALLRPVLYFFFSLLACYFLLLPCREKKTE
jgi:hypothetical protein